ncbi:MAG: hypothetical protein ABIP75_02165 [Pyrinomonadaceae bacterium]
MEADLDLEDLLEGDTLAQRFLLGELSEPERATVEDRLLAEPDLDEQFQSSEDDLIDAYVRAVLTAVQRTRFEQNYLTTPAHRERVEFARALTAAVSRPSDKLEPKLSHWWHPLLSGVFFRRPGFALAAVALLLVVALGGLWWWRTQPARPTASANEPSLQTRTAPPNEAPKPEVAATKPSPASPREIPARETPGSAPTVAGFTLLPGMVRGGAGVQLVVPAGTTEVRLTLSLEGADFPKYRINLSTPEGKRILTRDLRASSTGKTNQLTFGIPAGSLDNGDYVLELSGANTKDAWESVADYTFRIVKK